MQEAKHALLLYQQLKQTAPEDLLRKLELKTNVPRAYKRLRNSSSEDEGKTKKKRKS
jgi:hypothetical protein